jgi:ubiquinone/menaquinone biosynthesis C-methylase UbiE
MSPNITSRSPSGDLANLPCLDLEAIRGKSKATWSAGDFAVIGSTLQIVAESLCESADVRSAQRVLDVATGNGATALAAARRYADVVGIDFVPALLERARRRAEADGFPIEFREGDAQALPVESASFDRVLSTFGVMFAPDQARAAAELVRVCKPGGKIGLACWTPEGVLGESFRLISRYAPPPPGLEPAMSWGTEAHLRKLFGASIARWQFVRKDFVFRYRSFEHWLEIFRTYYGPVHMTFRNLDAKAQVALVQDLREMLERWNCSGDRTLVYPGEYLEAVLTKA